MNPKLIKHAEWIVATLLSAAVVFLLIVRVQSMGALWRDEAATLNLAQMPALSDIAANFQHEAFPLPFPLTVRAYIAIFGAGDASLRWFGFVIGSAIVAVAWFNSRALGDRGPLLFLALFGLNSTFLTWGPSLRGYGLGCAFLLLTLGLTVKAISQPSRANAVAVTIASIASVQIMVNAAPLVTAMAISALVVFMVRRQFPPAIIVSICAALCALSFLPYLKSYFGADWNVVLKYPVTFLSLCEKFRRALGEQGMLAGLFWYFAIPLIILGAIWRWWTWRRQESLSETQLLLFLIAVSTLSIFAYYAFLGILSYATRPWYYLPLLCFLAGAIDLIGGILAGVQWIRIARLLFAGAALLFLPFAVWKSAHQRFTNLDLVAHTLEQVADPDDLIVLNPWHYGPSFYRYYQGATPSITLPTMTEHRIHRYDLMKFKTMELDPLGDVRATIRQTLISGHQVWVVGGALPPDENMPRLGPAPNPYFGWAGYMTFWSMELGSFLNAHATRGDVVLSPAPGVNENENVPLLVAQGWKD